MNDWWNDPPEYDDGPTCPECAGLSTYLTGNSMMQRYECDECGHQYLHHIEPDPGPEDFGPVEFAEPPVLQPPQQCPHGRDWLECNPCMVASDLAYDAARERGLR